MVKQDFLLSVHYFYVLNRPVSANLKLAVADGAFYVQYVGNFNCTAVGVVHRVCSGQISLGNRPQSCTCNVYDV